MSNHIVSVRLPEVVVPGRRLGRNLVHDERSKDYPAATAEKIVSVLHKAAGLPLNQGDLGKCTCEATAGSANAQPPVGEGEKAKTDKDTDALYKVETKDEGQPWPPNDPGGSGLEVCKAAIKAGGWAMKSYTHAFSVDAALKALVLRPVMIGIPWYDSFDTPDKNGLVSIAKGASIRGYHELAVLQIIAEHELIGLPQSWGASWGVPAPDMGLPKGGAFYMSWDTLGACLKQQGDVTVPVFSS